MLGRAGYARQNDSGLLIKPYLAALKSNDHRSGSGFLLLLLLIRLSRLSAKVIIARHVPRGGAHARATRAQPRVKRRNQGDNKPLAEALFVIKTREMCRGFSSGYRTCSLKGKSRRADSDFLFRREINRAIERHREKYARDGGYYARLRRRTKRFFYACLVGNERQTGEIVRSECRGGKK